MKQNSERSTNSSTSISITLSIVFALIALAFVVSPGTINANVGLGVSPASITIQDALHNQMYEQTISILYTGPSQVSLDLSTTGDISEWAKFYDSNDLNTPVQSVLATPGSWKYIVAHFSIPDSAPVGTSTGTVFCTAAPAELAPAEGETGVAMKIQQQVTITIEIAGTPILSGTASDFNTIDTEIGQALRVKFQFENTGNVVATPKVSVDIAQDGKSIDIFTSNITSIRPKGTQTVAVEWPTAGRLPGDYSAHVNVDLGEAKIASGDVAFKLLPLGTLTRSGVFTSLVLDDNNPKFGTLAKMLASFTNIGKIDTKAQFLAEVYRDGKLVDAVKTAEIFVPVGQDGIITGYYKLAKPGNYRIAGVINYEGKVTEPKEVSFTVLPETGTAASSNSSGSSGSSPVLWISGIAVVGLIAAGIGFLKFRSSR